MPSAQPALQSIASDPRACPACPVCGSTNVQIRFADCRDLLFPTPGEFRVAACTACDALFCDPQITPEQFDTYYLASYYPTAEQIRARLRTKRFTRWALRRFWGAARRDTAARAALRRVLSLLSVRLRMAPPLHGAGRLLEIGCSSGEKLFILRDYGWRAEGIEPSADAHAEAEKLGLPARHCSLEDANLEHGAYDVIELTHVLEHLIDPIGGLSKLRDALAPDGKILLTLPNGRGVGLKAFGRYWQGLDLPRHCVVYTPTALRALCSRVGLEVRQVCNLVAPEVIIGSAKFALNALRADAHGPAEPNGADRCGSRYQPDRKLKNLAGRLARKAIAVALLPTALLGRGEVMHIEIGRADKA